MPNLDFKITNKSQQLEDLVEIQPATEYFIQNKGPLSILTYRGSVEPQEQIVMGTILNPHIQAKYVAIDDSNLYIKTIGDGESTIAIDDKK